MPCQRVHDMLRVVHDVLYVVKDVPGIHEWNEVRALKPRDTTSRGLAKLDQGAVKPGGAS